MKASRPAREVAAALDEYVALFDASADGSLDARKQAYQLVANHFYDMVTDFYQFGWGDSFHFAPRLRHEGLGESLARCERFFADELALRPGVKVLDVGCGVGGPLREIARHSGAAVTGINNNDFQVGKVERMLARTGLAPRCAVIKADFMHMPVADGAFDCAYTLEATPHAPDKIGVYREIFRVLRPGGVFIGDEWCVTPVYDPANARHRELKAGIEIGNALPDLATTTEVIEALRTAGFEVVVARDMAGDGDAETPWYRALQGRDLTLTGIPRTPFGRSLTNWFTGAFETLGMFPRGTRAVSSLLNSAADDLVAAGVAGVFTPLFYVKARKPGP